MCAADLPERGHPEQAVQEGHAAQNVLSGTVTSVSFSSYFILIQHNHANDYNDDAGTAMTGLGRLHNLLHTLLLSVSPNCVL